FAIQFSQRNRFIICELRFSLNNPRRPKHAHRIDYSPLAESENNVSRRRSRRCRIGFELLRETSGTHLDLRANTTAITDAAGKRDAKRTIRVTTVVARDLQTTTWATKDYVRIAVTIDIAGNEHTPRRHLYI